MQPSMAMCYHVNDCVLIAWRQYEGIEYSHGCAVAVDRRHPVIVHSPVACDSVRHAYFIGANDPYKALKTTLKAEINIDAWASLHSDTSRPFDKPKSGRIAVKVINHLGDEVMKVFRV